VFRHRFFFTFVASAGLLALAALPANAASPVQKKSVTGPNGKGTVARYQVKSGGKVSNWVSFTATDSDGPGGKCTEVWVDYSTSPHVHWNPGVFVNCSGGTRTLSQGLTNSGTTIKGMGVAVCAVPNTSGRITRNSSNCRGQTGAMYLHSGQRYSSFDVSADQHPSGIQVYH
jgi:hypothetical protein